MSVFQTSYDHSLATRSSLVCINSLGFLLHSLVEATGKAGLSFLEDEHTWLFIKNWWPKLTICGQIEANLWPSGHLHLHWTRILSYCL